jgi:hypothetical protein
MLYFTLLQQPVHYIYELTSHHNKDVTQHTNIIKLAVLSIYIYNEHMAYLVYIPPFKKSSNSIIFKALANMKVMHLILLITKFGPVFRIQNLHPNWIIWYNSLAETLIQTAGRLLTELLDRNRHDVSLVMFSYSKKWCFTNIWMK